MLSQHVGLHDLKINQLRQKHFYTTSTKLQWICLMLLGRISRLLQLDPNWFDLQPNVNYDTAEGENKLHSFRNCRLCIVSQADWPHSRSSEKKRPVGQTASFQPNTYLSRHIHLAAALLLQLPPFSPEGDRAAPFVARCALGPFGRADLAIYINIHKHIVATRYEPQLKAALTSPWPSHTSVTLICHPAFRNTQAPRWEHSVCGRLQRRQFWVLVLYKLVSCFRRDAPTVNLLNPDCWNFCADENETLLPLRCF